MANILFIKANDRPSEQSVSVRMYETFLQAYKESHPEDTVTELDLFKSDLPYYGNTAITGLFKESRGLEATDEERKAAAIANRYLDQFMDSDKIVFAFPLWNFTVPAPLNTYISYLMQVGKTFRYTAEGPVGLAADKQVALLAARGGDYSVPHMAALEMALNYVKASIGLWGIVDPESVVIEGHNQFPDRAAEIVEAGISRTAALAASF